MARYWSDGYKSTEQVGSPAETTVTMVDRVRWDNKQDPLVFDDHPVLGSGSPVTSDGIARAMLQLQDFVKQKDVELCYIDVVTQADEAVLSDKTYIDIRDAYNNGKTLILRFVDSDDKCAYFYDFQGNVFRFVMFEVTDVLNMYTYWISPDDLLHTEQYSAPYKRPNPEVLSITYGDTSVKYDGSKHASINLPKVPAWALGDTKPKYDASEVGAETKGVAASRVNAHNNSDTAHADIRNLIANIMGMFNTYATTTQLNSVMQTVQGYASAVQTLRQDAVLHTEVVDDMYTNNSRMPLSAKQGMLLRTMYDALKPVHVGVTMWNGNSVDTIPYYSTVPLANAVPCTDGGGRLSTNPPVDALHCANKKYVDDAILSSVVITEKTEGQIPVITDCAEVPPINIKLFGKGKQEVIPGNQLFDISKVVGHSTNVSSVEVVDNCIKIVMPEGYSGSGYTELTCTLAELSPELVAGNTYILSAHVSSTGTVPDTNKKIYAGYGWMFGSSVTVTEAMLKEKVTLYGSTNAGTTTISDIMLNEGTTSKPCEQYVGGEPSPNMKYPQIPEFLGEIGSIGGKVLTRNLFDGVTKDSIFSFGTDAKYRRIEKFFTVGTYTMCFSQPIYLASNDANAKNMTYSQSFTFNIAEDGEYFFQFRLNSNVEWDFNTLIWIVNGTEALPYEPYTEQPFTFQTPNGLRGIPLGQTIPDAIKNSPIHMSGVYWDKEEGQYYIGDTKNEDGNDVQRIGKDRLLASRLRILDSYCN